MNDQVKRDRPSVDNVTRYLREMNFPADRDTVIRHARRQAVGDDVLELLDRIPNRDYGSLDDVAKGMTQVH